VCGQVPAAGCLELPRRVAECRVLRTSIARALLRSACSASQARRAPSRPAPLRALTYGAFGPAVASTLPLAQTPGGCGAHQWRGGERSGRSRPHVILERGACRWHARRSGSRSGCARPAAGSVVWREGWRGRSRLFIARTFHASPHTSAHAPPSSRKTAAGINSEKSVP
jgi:hypothetical protein